jgi:hypothetical protein
MGHESQGSVGARVYTHIDAGTLKVAIENIKVTSLNKLPILLHE